jgi:hypothetical protein
MYQTEIHIKGKINPHWSDWFGELQVHERSCDETILVGTLPDMAAVYGVISRLGSLVIPLISVSCVEELDASFENSVDHIADS